MKKRSKEEFKKMYAEMHEKRRKIAKRRSQIEDMDDRLSARDDRFYEDMKRTSRLYAKQHSKYPFKFKLRDKKGIPFEVVGIDADVDESVMKLEYELGFYTQSTTSEGKIHTEPHECETYSESEITRKIKSGEYMVAPADLPNIGYDHKIVEIQMINKGHKVKDGWGGHDIKGTQYILKLDNGLFVKIRQENGQDIRNFEDWPKRLKFERSTRDLVSFDLMYKPKRARRYQYSHDIGDIEVELVFRTKEEAVELMI